jgi:hypothetical protein
MAKRKPTVERILHFRMRTTTTSATQLLSIVKAAIPFYQAGGGRVRVLRNVDDPGQIVQVIEYDMDAALEMNRQRIASDPAMQTYLMGWRSLLQGAVEVDVYEDVTDLK